MTHPAPPTRHVCGARALLPDQLAADALTATAGTRDTRDIRHHLRCTLEGHTSGDHYAFIVALDGPNSGSIWAYWPHGRRATGIDVLPDCDASADITGEPCCGPHDHPGGHGFELHDPWRTAFQRLSA